MRVSAYRNRMNPCVGAQLQTQNSLLHKGTGILATRIGIVVFSPSPDSASQETISSTTSKSIDLHLVFHSAAKYPPQIPSKPWKVTFSDDQSSYASCCTAHQICEQQMAFSIRQVLRGEAYKLHSDSRNELQNFLSKKCLVCRLTGLCEWSERVPLVYLCQWEIHLNFISTSQLKLLKTFCGALTKDNCACFQVFWVTKQVKLHTIQSTHCNVEKGKSDTSLMNNSN